MEITAKFLIERNAEQFMVTENSNNPVEFKSNLESELYNYHEDNYRLIYLYKVMSYLDTDQKRHEDQCPNPKPCGHSVQYMQKKFFTEQEIKSLNPAYNFQVFRSNVNVDVIKKNLFDLQKYPKAGELLQSAMNKFNEGKHDRNAIDDLRLCLETLLKQKLGNDKSLENQVAPMGEFLKDSGVSVELRNMITKHIEYYAKYQNEHIKHNDDVKDDEIEFMVNLTSSLIRFVITVKS